MSARAGVRAGRVALLALVAGCRAPSPAPEPDPPAPAARRAEIVAALHRQLELVLARHAELADEPGDAARAERAELVRRARAIRIAILRTDPNADVAALVERLDGDG